MATIGTAPQQPEQPEQPPTQQRYTPHRKRGISGALLFFITLGVALVLIVISTAALASLGGENPESAIVAPAVCLLVWFIFFIVLLYFAGRAISDKNRPGEAGTAIVLALFLTPVILSALPIAIGAQGALGLADAFAGEDEAIDEEFSTDLGNSGEVEVGVYGSDPELDALYDSCSAGEAEACDDLWVNSPSGSEYEMFAEANGGGS